MSSKQYGFDPQHGTLYLAGEQVPAGTYRNIKSGREIHLSQAGILPPSFDGSVAVYATAPRTWAGLMQESAPVEPLPSLTRSAPSLPANYEGWDDEPEEIRFRETVGSAKL